jgi:predicted nucleotidyltransferase
VDRTTRNHEDDTRIPEDDRFILARYAHFREAAEYVAAAFALLSSVRRVALFGSVASSPKSESGRVRRGGSILHEPKDVDVAVWIDHAADLDGLRALRSRAVTELWNDKEVGVAHHQVDVFLVDAAGTYLGRLCCFNQCPKHKPDCRALNCGRIPFLRQHDGFVLDPDALRADRIKILYERTDQPPALAVPA